MELQQLKALYEAYETEYKEVIRNAAPTDGLFGMGRDPRKDPCHMRFYGGVEKWVSAFLADSPDRETAYQAAHRILTAAAEHRDEPSYWFLFAAQGHCRGLIGLLSPEQCARLREMYDDRYPRRERMPAQKEVYSLLCKGAAKK